MRRRDRRTIKMAIVGTYEGRPLASPHKKHEVTERKVEKLYKLISIHIKKKNTYSKTVKRRTHTQKWRFCPYFLFLFFIFINLRKRKKDTREEKKKYQSRVDKQRICLIRNAFIATVFFRVVNEIKSSFVVRLLGPENHVHSPSTTADAL